MSAADSSDPATEPVVQPFLHDLVTGVCAPSVVLSGTDGQIDPSGVRGWLVADLRHLSELVVLVDGMAPEAVGHHRASAAEWRFVGAVRRLGDPIADPTVRVQRSRTVRPDRLDETIALVNDARRAVRATLTVRLGADLALIQAIKSGRRARPVVPRWTGGTWAEWATGSATTSVGVDRAPDTVEVTDDRVVLGWTVTVGARDRLELTVTATARGGTVADDPAGGAGVFPPPESRPPWRRPVTVHSREPRLDRLVRTGLDDVGALTLADESAPDDRFVAAGSPWYLTLFGRDSIWAARFTLPLGTGLAAGTLRTLARRQGTRHDPTTAEQPGRMPHEIRRVVSGIDRAGALPPCYFGTIDATPLWISLLHDAWRWGLPRAEVAALLDPLRRALEWVIAHGDADGFLAYRDESGAGLTNQGWKDSTDSIQDGRGALAAAPVALCEAQGYAHRAALDAAVLLDAFDVAGADQARAYARALRDRFRGAFWVRAGAVPFPALALDGAGNRVDSVASNMGHLLGTGLLSTEEQAHVARWLADPRLDSGHGLRTLDAEHPFFNPLGYHTGSVWPHDTAIAITGLARAGHPRTAAALADGVVRAGAWFGDQLPELFGGWPAESGPPLDYPAACRPIAWAAASAVPLVQAALGLAADVPGGRLTVAPAPEFAAWFPLRVTGLEVAGHPLDIDVDQDGNATVRTDAPLDVHLGG